MEADARPSTRLLPGIDQLLLRRVVRELVEAGDVHEGDRRGETVYFLSDRCAAHMRALRRENNRRCNRVLRTLFKSEEHVYRKAFLEVIYAVLDAAATEYVVHLADGNALRSVKARWVLREAVERVVHESRGVDPKKLASAVIKFFKKTDGDFSYLKWRVIQGFFVMKMLGLDPDSFVSSKALFRDTRLVIDTNNAIDALESSRKLHREFRILADAAAVIDLNIVIASITLKELGSWITGERERFKQLEAGVKGAEARVDSHLLARYRREKVVNPGLTLDDFFAPFDNPRQRLEDEFGIDVVDDDWFQEEVSPETLALADALERRGEEHRKTYESALHDALILRWIIRESSEGRTVNFLSSDTSLPSTTTLPHRGGRVINPAAFVNWMASAVRGVIDDADFPRLYAHLLRHQILPMRDVFSSASLQVFVDQERLCNSLTDDEVDAIFEYLERDAVDKDPSDEAHRVEITENIRRRRTSSPEGWRPAPEDDWFVEVSDDDDVAPRPEDGAPPPAKQRLRRRTIARLKAAIGLGGTGAGALALTWAIFLD
ncbi:MAG: hypothetical protein M3271_11035, partial [Actinomycetota bacterium]|nr:hypothetical protein [Actinomycetota bacterium]